ncbi:Isopentenyl-diphosphate Delta-isomerase [Hondaea fermentalgiana]|uniref:isopentenyl-diphosphate Delta-isomerase n=1 Tax=Hondaea fermentalgiana TaxID=2315210 RepID=A0A2R5G859_9STRA|nr:Isopentenyl-diphosphate Delta-isomerase [Hondaea fermentalgiana]|eukprot:GBG26735.1 Isopentenyl-diphosphate Delta-isomerase [Hondaea fermentalgiana]
MAANPSLESFDATQVALMEERVIVVDTQDKAERPGTKLETHLLENIDKGLLHRAFSVFLFNSEGKLLLQKRSDDKITFPAYWANTCCSHPLWVDGEMELKDALGVKRAAIRKLEHELGIKAEQVPIEKFHYLTRIHYVAKMEGTQWGEHEIDHVLVIQADVDVAPVPNEVAEARYFSEEELKTFLEEAPEKGTLISPWFGYIQKMFLGKWWQAMRDGDLKSCEDHETIHRIAPAKE